MMILNCINLATVLHLHAAALVILKGSGAAAKYGFAWFVLIICVDTGIDDGYWKGEVDGKQGMFPSMLVEEVDTVENNQELPPPTDTQQDHQQQPNQVI